MSGFWWAVRAEWLRLARPARALALPAAAGLAALYAWGLSAAADSGVLGAKSGFYVAAAASSGVAMTCALVGALFASATVGSDLSHGVARSALTRPVSRGAWMTARIATLCASLCALLICASVGPLLVGAARYGLTGAFEGDYQIASAGFLAGQWAIALALSLAGLCCAVALGGLMGCLFGRAGAAVVAAAVCGAALAALSRWPRAERLVPLTYLTSAHDRVAQLSQGISAPHAGDGAMTGILVCLVWLAAASALAALALRRRDVLT
jgi:ABC-type transport system involved in multi-copper enzyme maturation permease subunit